MKPFNLNIVKNLIRKLSLKKGLDLIKKPVFKNMLIVVIITLLIKGLALYKERIVGAEYGAGEFLDTFILAMLIPGFISNVFIGAYRNVFIPNYIIELKKGKDIRAFQSTGFLVTALISIFFILVSILFTDVFLESFYGGHTAHFYTLVRDQFYIVAPSIFFWGISALLKSLLNIDNEFTLTSLGGIITPLPIIIGLFYFQDTFGLHTLAISTLIGSLLGFIYLLTLALNRNLIRLGKPDFKSENVRMMFRQVFPKVSSGFLTGLLPVTDKYFAAQIIEGSVTALRYGLSIPAAITGMLVVAVNNVLLPHFSKMVIDNKAGAFKALFKNLKIMFVGAALVALFLIFISQELVELFFEKGKFSAENTATVTKIQIIFLIYTPFTICGMVLVNFLTSINKNAFMAYVSFGAMSLNFILDFILIKHYGVFGIAICTTCVYVIRSLILLAYTVRQEKKLINKSAQ